MHQNPFFHVRIRVWSDITYVLKIVLVAPILDLLKVPCLILDHGGDILVRNILTDIIIGLRVMEMSIQQGCFMMLVSLSSLIYLVKC